MTNQSAIGIDFGTTNSSIARADASGEVELAHVDYSGGTTEAYRSLLYLEHVKNRGLNAVKSWTGPAAIDHYLAAETKGRLIQSLKSFLSSHSLKSTDVFGRKHPLEELIARILRDIRELAERQFGIAIRSAVVGRPVRFVGAEIPEDDAYALARLKAAFQIAGYETVQFEMEPVAAAHYYESTLDHDELILIGDFGGGTSDFSLLYAGPSIRKRGRTQQDLLGNAGLGLAGDAFDAKIIRNLVSPALGAGSQMRSMHKILPVPVWVYGKLERWHHLSFLKARDIMNMLNSVKTQALEPHKIEALLHLIEEDLGYHLHRSVQKLKSDLSSRTEGKFHFTDAGITIEAAVRRIDFEKWIEDELTRIETCVDSLLSSCGIHPNDVNMVFLTGGTSFVPAVRKIFETRFGPARIRAGNEFTSVARGLALKALDLQQRP
jgi:hypothetical chaperone protein